MLSFLLTTVNTTLLGSKGFYVASLLPVLLFAAALLGLDLAIHPDHAKWADEVSKEKPGTTLIAIALALISGAYVFSSTNSLLRELLEGRVFSIWMLSRLRPLFLGVQRAKEREAREEFEKRQVEYWAQSVEDWVAKLREARKNGHATNRAPGAVDSALRTKVEGISSLDDLRDEGKIIGEAVDNLSEKLSGVDINRAGSQDWNRVHVMLVDICKRYAAQLQDLRVEAFGRSSVYPAALRPTRLGNIAATLRAYPYSRYGMELDVFWTRFQRLIAQDDKTAAILQDAKVQLDFFVSMTWVCAVLSLVGSVVLGFESDRLWLFLVTSIGGPMLALLFYHLACESYRGFAEVVRGLVDVLRFQLIEAFHLTLPVGSDEERQLWNDLTNRVGYDSALGDIFYRHGK